MTIQSPQFFTRVSSPKVPCYSVNTALLVAKELMGAGGSAGPLTTRLPLATDGLLESLRLLASEFASVKQVRKPTPEVSAKQTTPRN